MHILKLMLIYYLIWKILPPLLPHLNDSIEPEFNFSYSWEPDSRLTSEHPFPYVKRMFIPLYTSATHKTLDALWMKFVMELI
jgi:hypothetical protein